MVSAYIVILLCRYQHEQLRLSITSFPLSCFPFIYLLLIFTLYYCSNQYLISYWVGGLRLNYLIPQAFLIPSGFPLASPVLLRCSSYLCSIYECECVRGNTKVCFSNIPVPVCVCACAVCMCVCVQYLASASVLESPRVLSSPRCHSIMINELGTAETTTIAPQQYISITPHCFREIYAISW